LKNTKSFEINANANLNDKNKKEKATIIIDTEKNIERKINKNRSKNEEIICIDKVEVNTNIDKENDKNQINTINNNKNEGNENKKEEIIIKENKEEKEEINNLKEKEEIKNVNNYKEIDSKKLNENLNEIENQNMNHEIVKREKEKEKTNKNEKEKPEKMKNIEIVSKDKEQINNKKEEIKKDKKEENEKIDKKIKENKEKEKVDNKKNKENEEIKKVDKIKENKEKEKIEMNKENKEIEKVDKKKENKEKEKIDDNKENKDNNKIEENNEKDKKEIKYNSPVKKNKSKKKKKYSQEGTSNTPIIIQFKPLSPKHGEIPIKDPDDLVPIYFNTSTINNVQIPKDYLNVIYYNLLNEEKENRKNFKSEYNYMNNQKEITEQMRSILIDWIIDVHGKFGFCDETLYMTVSIIDRYSSIKKITRNEYQCLGITALMISCKHEEINVPKVEDFIYITDNAYTKQEVFNMEIDILDKLKYNLLYPSPIKFYEYLSLHFGFDKKKHFLGKYLMETFLLDLICIKFKPSIISCACIYIVMKFFKMKNYKESYLKKWYMIEGKEGFELENGCGIKDCAQEMCNFVDNIGSTKYLSCQKKYSADDYCNISKLIVNYPENNNNKKEDKKEDDKKE
jgi:cyclin B